jgi:hypothetical protein
MVVPSQENSVAQPSDKIDAEILPEPELNPLLNPLLAAHMGRWAEVYFTSPPEKRAQAVSDLVRELRGGSSIERTSAQPVVAWPTAAQSKATLPSVDKTLAKGQAAEPARAVSEKLPPSPLSPPVADLRRTCSECFAENSAEQNFCGMCGAPLQSLRQPQESTRPEESKFHATEVASEASWNEPQSLSQPESAISGYPAAYPAERSLSFGGYAHHDSREPEWSVPDADLPSFAVESEPVSYRYRLYIGIAIALLLGGLLYKAWRGTPGSSGDTTESVPSRVIPAEPSRAPPTEPSRATPAPAAATAGQPASKRNILPTEPAAGATPAAAAPAAGRTAESQNQQTASPTDQAPKAARAASPRIVPVAANSSVPVAGDHGEEELSTAEKYLNRTNYGGARDNQEAAQWLWKAVGKGNLTATMTLSDLYLRGDGVPKSCDQARLLLVAAARKGKASAAERLRNLQAFGCQ